MEYKFKFSIIMGIYNVEKYLDEAVNSIVSQDIGFSDNVQLILVNDGTPDNSEEICMKYKRLFPNNIVYVKKENGGLASAKNVGLEYAEGEYINFFDSDDRLPHNTLREVYDFFKRNGLCVDFVTLPLVFFEGQRGRHAKYKYMGNKNRIIDLIKEPYNFVLSGAASFYKESKIKGFRFDETYSGEEDTLLNGLLYKENPKFGFVCEKGVRYNYRKRIEQGSLVDSAKGNANSYITVLKLLDRIIDNAKPIPSYQQEIIIYEIRSRLKNIQVDIFENEDQYNFILDGYKKYLNMLDPEYVVFRSKYCDTISLKHLFISLGGLQPNFLNDFINCYTGIDVQYFDFKDNHLYVDVTFYNYSQDNLDVLAYNNSVVFEPFDKSDFNSALDNYIGAFTTDQTHLRRFKFDISKIEQFSFILYDKKTKQYYPSKNVKLASRTEFNSYNKTRFYNEYKVQFTGRKFIITKLEQPKLSFILKNIKTILSTLKNVHRLPLTRLFNRQIKEYILINDRYDKAGDNGEAVFKYINQHEPSLAKKTYFAISDKSEDYKRLKKYGKVVKHGSIKHKILFLNSKIIFSSHTMPQYYNAYKVNHLYLFRDLFNYKFVWLQHGVTQNDISSAANRYIKKIDYITVSTLSEHKEFTQKKYCFDDNQVLLTGFARFDYLDNYPKNVITIAPTWRRGFGNSGGRNPEFVNTQYYLEFKEILTSEKLLCVLEKYNLKIRFVLHPEMDNYLQDFKLFENSFVEIVKPKDVDYSKFFSDSVLFITDYSSTLFDFAYLEKPEILFQFDRDQFYSSHYKKGYFNYDTDAFGDVLTTSSEVIDKIETYAKASFKIEKEYLDRIQNTFKYVDKNNSKRIVDIVCK